MDENQVIATPTEREVWLAPGWIDQKPVTAKQPAGYTRVTVRTVRYADGREVDYVLDENHQPITSQVLEQTINPQQRQAFLQGRSPAERKPTRTYRGTDPATGQPATVSEWPDVDPQTGQPRLTYEQITPAAGSQVTTPHIEGTPIPGTSPVQYDNTHPIKVNRDAQGRQVGPGEELSAAERTQWERETGQQQTSSQQDPLKGYPGWTTKTVKVGNDQKTVFINPQGQEAPDPQPAADAPKPTYTTQEINGQRYTTELTPGVAGAGPTIKHFGPNGTAIASLPAQVKPGEIVKGGGPKGEDVQATADPTTGVITYQPITGALPAASQRPLPPGLPPLDLSSPENAHRSYLAQVQWAQQQRQAGTLAAKDAQDALQPGYEAATSVITAGQQQLTNAINVRKQNLDERGQDIGEVESRRSFQGTGFDTLFKDISGNAAHLGRGNGPLAAAALREALGMRQQYAADVGGFRDVPASPLSAAVEAARAATQVHVAPNGNVAVSPPGALPPGVPSGADVAAATAAPQAQSQAAVGVGPGAAPAHAVPAAQGAAVPAVAPVQGLPPNRPDQTQVPAQIEGAINPPASPGLPPLPATRDADPLLTVIHTPTGRQSQVRLSTLNSAANSSEYQVIDPTTGQTVQAAAPAPVEVFSPIQASALSDGGAERGNPEQAATPPAPPASAPAAVEPIPSAPAPSYGAPGMRVLPHPGPTAPSTYGSGEDIQTGMVPSYLKPARALVPRYDPSPVLARLRARGIPQDVIDQALAEHHQEWGVPS